MPSPNPTDCGIFSASGKSLITAAGTVHTLT
jgi:hypothetical protein